MGTYVPIEETVESEFGGFFRWYMYAINSFIMPMMFLISGYFVPRSIHKKGVVRYLKEHLARLVIPFLAGPLLINNESVLLSKYLQTAPMWKRRRAMFQ